jgi:hypothetical protein
MSHTMSHTMPQTTLSQESEQFMLPLEKFKQFLSATGVPESDKLFELDWFCQFRVAQQFVIDAVFRGKAAEIDIHAPDCFEKLDTLYNLRCEFSLKALKIFLNIFGVRNSEYLFEQSWFCVSRHLQCRTVRTVFNDVADRVNVFAPNFREHLAEIDPDDNAF